MAKPDAFEKAMEMALKQAEEIALLTSKKIMQKGIFATVEVVKEDNNTFDVVYKEGDKSQGLVYVAIGSIDKIKGSLVDIGFDIGFYEDGEREDIKQRLEAAMAEYTKRIPRMA